MSTISGIELISIVLKKEIFFNAFRLLNVAACNQAGVHTPPAAVSQEQDWDAVLRGSGLRPHLGRGGEEKEI